MRPRSRYRQRPLSRWKTLVVPGSLAAPLTLTRAQLSGVQSSATGADGATLGLFGADVARFNGTARRLLIEGQRTNAIRNPRAEGAVAGTPGTLPTNWFDSAAGLTRTVVGMGTQNSIFYVDVRWAGTTTNTFLNINFEGINVVAAANGEAWAASAFVAVVGGSFSNVTGLRSRVSVNNGLVYLGELVDTPPNLVPLLSGALARQPTTAGTIAQASATNVAPYLQATFANGAAIDFTLRIGFPQLERGAFSSTPILPPVGTPGASTRGADLVSASLSSLGIPASGACTVLWSGMIPQAAPSSAHQAIAQIDDGTNDNRLTLRNVQGTANVGIIWVVSGVGAGTATGGALTAGTPFRVGVSMNGAGRAAASLNGGAAAIVTGGISGGLTTLRLGQQIGGAEMFGETTLLRVLPYTLSDTNLAAAVAALPT